MNLASLPIPDRILLMKQFASQRVAAVNGNLNEFARIEKDINDIATAQLASMAPVNVNLLGYAMILMAEITRLRSKIV